MYLQSNTRLYVSFAVNRCAWFTHNTKAPNETSMKRIFRYLQGTKDKGLVFNPPKKPVVVEFYADEDFLGMWGHVNLQDPICARSRTGFVVAF